MNASLEAWLAEREHDMGDVDRTVPVRGEERFRMAMCGKFRQVRKPSAKGINGMHKRRQKKVLL